MPIKHKKELDGSGFRALFIGLSFSFVIALIGAKAVHLQVFKKQWLLEKAQDQVQRSVVTYGKRGIIYDAKDQELAVTLDTDSIGIHPGQVVDKEAAARSLAKALGFNHADITRKLAGERTFVWLKRQASPKEKAAVEALGLQGVVFVPEYRRFYPKRTLAAQVIGFSGMDGRGLEGIECSYQRYLEGKEVKASVLKDARGRSFSPDKTALAEASGHSVILTIDEKIQFSAEKYLESAVKEFNGKSGIALVMDPRSGAVLAMAHYPNFNPNTYTKFPRETWRNRAIADSYEPGSTMKIFTASAALESTLCTPESAFYCENGKYRIGRSTLHDTHDYGWLSLSEIVKYSSNIGAIKVAETIGAKSLGRTLTAFGFGEKLGIDCPGETSGRLASHKRWKPVEMATIAFGQGIAVSALQLTTAACAIANGGNLMQPFLVQAIKDPQGRLIRKTEPRVIQRVLSEKTAYLVRQMMRTVVEPKGTGTNASLERYTVGGKTGTAQKVGSGGGYERGSYVASFVGMVPWDDPEVVILVLVDEPRPRYYGGTVAAPAFKRIAEDVTLHMNIQPAAQPPPALKTVSVEGGAG